MNDDFDLGTDVYDDDFNADATEEERCPECDEPLYTDGSCPNGCIDFDDEDEEFDNE